MAKKKAKKATKKTTKTTAKKAKSTTKKSTMKAAGTKKTATKKAAPTKKAATKKTATKKAATTAKTATSKAATTTVKAVTKNIAGTMAQTVTVVRAVLGNPVPNFEVAGTGGQKLTLEGLKGRQVVLYFYPKDATPGCTIQGHEFTKLHNDFKELGVEVYGVSRDSVDSHEKFKTDECYSIDLLSDAKGELCNMFDVMKDKNMYGKMVSGIERSTFLIDADGNLVKEWRGVKPAGHAQEVLEWVKTQNA